MPEPADHVRILLAILGTKHRLTWLPSATRRLPCRNLSRLTPVRGFGSARRLKSPRGEKPGGGDGRDVLSINICTYYDKKV